jgi:hypothetical protein
VVLRYVDLLRIWCCCTRRCRRGGLDCEAVSRESDMEMSARLPGTSFSISLRDFGGPPCSAVIFWRREAPLFAASRSRRSRAFVWVGVSPGSASVEGAEAGESAMMRSCLLCK